MDVMKETQVVKSVVIESTSGRQAALAAGSGTIARDIDVKEIQTGLLVHNVCLGRSDRLDQLGLA